MSKKKHPEHVNHERWLVSYADFITLLFAFFVVLFASGQSDKSKQKKISASITTAFAEMAMFDSHSKSPALSDNPGSGTAATPSPVQLPIDASNAASNATSNAVSAAASSASVSIAPSSAHDAADPLKAEAVIAAAHAGDAVNIRPLTEAQLHDAVIALIKKQQAAGELHTNDVSLRPTPDGLTLSLQEGGFFDSGSATIRPAALTTLTAIARTLTNTPLRIEGHTDNVPVHSALYASNWELSSARACAIARFLIDNSRANPAQITIAGYAEFHPIASNTTPEGRAKNRRVDIVFLKPPATPQAPTSSRPTPSR